MRVNDLGAADRQAGVISDEIVTLRIATNRLDFPAELIAGIYRQRWLIEMFFRLRGRVRCRTQLRLPGGTEEPAGGTRRSR
ncbi:MAG: hypothetical protein ACK5SI_05070 [Planctomycetia bacterium]